MDPKSFYKTYQADDNWSKLSTEMFNLVRELDPVHVLEYGSGSGKNISKLSSRGIVCCGLDISFTNLCVSKFKNGNEFLILGDQSHLRHLCNFDIVLTVSVCDHIEDIQGIVEEFKRIANKAVFLAETSDTPGKYYYPHDYELLGFEKLGFKWVSPDDGATYNIYKWMKWPQ